MLSSILWFGFLFAMFLPYVCSSPCLSFFAPPTPPPLHLMKQADSYSTLQQISCFVWSCYSLCFLTRVMSNVFAWVESWSVRLQSGVTLMGSSKCRFVLADATLDRMLPKKANETKEEGNCCFIQLLYAAGEEAELNAWWWESDASGYPLFHTELPPQKVLINAIKCRHALKTKLCLCLIYLCVLVLLFLIVMGFGVRQDTMFPSSHVSPSAQLVCYWCFSALWWL